MRLDAAFILRYSIGVRSTTFVLGAGFSAFAGFPLVAGLRDDVLRYVRERLDLAPHVQEQFCEGLRLAETEAKRADLHFEELLLELTRQLRNAHSSDPRHTTRRLLRAVTGRLLWDRQEALRCAPLPIAYEAFARNVQRQAGDRLRNAIVSFNWDLVAEWCLKSRGVPWLYSNSSGPVPVLKPHGSINWSKHLQEGVSAEYNGWQPVSRDSKFCYDRRHPFHDPFPNGVQEDLRGPMIFPGDSDDPGENESLRLLWDQVEAVMSARERLVFIGYSLPSYDCKAVDLLARCSRGKHVEIVNPNREHLQRFAEVFGAGVQLDPNRFEASSYASLRDE